MYVCPCCQQKEPWTEPKVANVEDEWKKDALTSDEPFKRTYIGHGRQSSVFVFQGHKGPFRPHKHVTHDEIGYVLAGSGTVTIGDETRAVKPGDVWVIPSDTPHAAEFEDECRVLFISSPIDDPDNQDRVWLDE